MNFSRMMDICSTTETGLRRGVFPALEERYWQLRRSLEKAVAKDNNWPEAVEAWPTIAFHHVRFGEATRQIWTEFKAFVNETRETLFQGVDLS